MHYLPFLISKVKIPDLLIKCHDFLLAVGNLFGNWALILGPWCCLRILSTRLLSGVLLSWNKGWTFLQLLQWVWAGLQFRVFAPCWKIDIWLFASFLFAFAFHSLLLSSLGVKFVRFISLLFWANFPVPERTHLSPSGQSCPVSMLLLMKGWKTVSCSYNPCTCSLFLFLHHLLKTGRSIVSK
jgi:hypothetical protein